MVTKLHSGGWVSQERKPCTLVRAVTEHGHSHSGWAHTCPISKTVLMACLSQVYSLLLLPCAFSACQGSHASPNGWAVAPVQLSWSGAPYGAVRHRAWEAPVCRGRQCTGKGMGAPAAYPWTSREAGESDAFICSEFERREEKEWDPG